MINNVASEVYTEVISPGRINIIGEHTDYNNGFVLPSAIDKSIVFKMRKNNSKYKCTIESEGFASVLNVDLRSIKRSKVSWENYILGVLDELLKKEVNIRGFDCTITSQLPVGAGLSSSAALECGLASGLNQLFQLGISRKDIAFFRNLLSTNLWAQNVESWINLHP
ncbi:MAG: galactokinase family protein [Flavobacteriaceae bacterium]